MPDQTAIREHAAKRGLFVSLAVFAVPLIIALSVLFWAMRDHDALHRAAAAGDVAQVEQILDRHPDRLEARNKLRETPLLTAVWHGQAEVAAVLVRRGADVNATWDLVATDDGRWNALHIAASHNRVEAAKVMIRAGTDVNGKSLKGETPLDVAVRNAHWEMIGLLRAHGGVSGRHR